MKVTALVPDEIVTQVTRYSGGKTTTEALLIALTEWLALKKIKNLNRKIERNPFRFQKSFTAARVRRLNRRRDLS